MACCERESKRAMCKFLDGVKSKFWKRKKTEQERVREQRRYGVENECKIS